MTFTSGEIKYIWKHRGNTNYHLKTIKAKEEIVESLIFDDIKNNCEVSGKILSSPKEGEAYHWPRLMHINLAPLLDILSINETVSIYISVVFEKSLRDTIQEEEFTKSPDCLSKKKSYAEDILWALDYLHGKSLCLMNLNEDNIYVSSRNDKAIITDFSCLTLVDRAVKSRVAVPTLYRAPELADSSEKFHPQAAEMWACGVLMLQIFSDQVESSFDGEPDKYVLKFVQSLCGKLDESSNSVEECNAVDEFKIFMDLFLKVDPFSRTTASNAALSSFLRRRMGSGDLRKTELGENSENNNQLLETNANLLTKSANSVKNIPVKRNARSFVTLEYASDQEKVNNEKFKVSLRNYLSLSPTDTHPKRDIVDETEMKSENNSSCSDGIRHKENLSRKVISNEEISDISTTIKECQYANLSEPISNLEIQEIHADSNILPFNQANSNDGALLLQPLDERNSRLSINQPDCPTENKERCSNEGSTSLLKIDTASDSSEDEDYSTDSLEVSGIASESNESLSAKENLTKLPGNNPSPKIECLKRCLSGNSCNSNNSNVRQELEANDTLEIEDDGESGITLHSEDDVLAISSPILNTHSLPSDGQAKLSKNETGHQEEILYNYEFLNPKGEKFDSSGKKNDLKRKSILEDEYSTPLLIKIQRLHSPISISQMQISEPKPEVNRKSNTTDILMKDKQNEFHVLEESSDFGGVNKSGLDYIVGDFAPSGDTLVEDPVSEKPNNNLSSNLEAIISNENDKLKQDELEKSAEKHSMWFVNRYGELEPSDFDFFGKIEKKKKKREKSKFQRKSWFYHFCPGCQARGDEVEMLCSVYKDSTYR